MRKTSSSASQALTPFKGVKPAVKTKKTTVKQTISANADVVKWHWHALIDVSLENRPLFRAPKAGERTLDIAAQSQHATLPQGGGLQVGLRLRAHISLPEGTLALAEIQYVGVADMPESPANIQLLQQQLYPLAREALALTLQMAGQTPPLPQTLTELNG